MDMNKITAALSLAVCMLGAGPAFPERAVYTRSDGFSEDATLSRTASGYLVRSTSDYGMKMESELDASFATRSWKLVNEREKTDVHAERSGDRIVLGGTFKGRAFQKTYAIDRAPWVEGWGLGLRTFVMGNEKQAAFW